ncbi:MAG: CcoQ/FixQ family Cbb3-type cytochrome c oxidase assembly chaperone [Chitinophagaceae bacterium]|nr:CcoQ/FixQ family Cbb3-type cytochrome c oxidase assembly chaperone [Chitinophagaceae bacterium]
MFKFIKQYAETIDHVNIYPIISLSIFLLFFVMLLFFVFKISKEKVDILSNIPLEEDSTNN